MLEVRARIQRGGFALEMDFVSRGKAVALFGRSGAGKSTVADLVAGLIRPSSGLVAVGETVLLDTERGIHVPAWERRIGYVFQDSRLFPHLGVTANLLYGARFRRAASTPFPEVVDLLGLAPLLERPVGGLSGGEARRVAIGRALLSDPRLLILDEPLSGLDGALREDILPYLDRLAASGLPLLFVTHDVEDVARLADEVVLVVDGKVFGAGAPSDALARPEAAAAAGINAPISILEGVALAGEGGGPPTSIDLGGTHFQTPPLHMPAGGRVRVVIDGRDVAIALTDPEHVSFQNRLPVSIATIERRSDGVLLDLEGPGLRLKALISAIACRDLGLTVGRSVVALIKAAAAARHL